MSLKTIKTLKIGEGIFMDIRINDAEPEDSINRYAAVSTATGDGDALYVPPHWHKNHSEYLTVHEGRLEITLNSEKFILKAGDPTAVIPRRAVHSLMGFKGERLVVTEVADPGGDYKALFFNDLASTGNITGSFWHVLRASYDGDGYLALPLYFRFFDVAFTTIFGGIAHWIAPPKPVSL